MASNVTLWVAPPFIVYDTVAFALPVNTILLLVPVHISLSVVLILAVGKAVATTVVLPDRVLLQLSDEVTETNV